MIRTATETPTLDDVIKSDTFEPIGENLGCGCWGRVDVYKDPSGRRWAIKTFSPNETAQRQMTERKWTEEDVMRRETIPLEAAAENVVPRLIERDKKGKMYVAMPVFDRTLAEEIRYMNLEGTLKLATDLTTGLKYLHSHRDLSSENFNQYKVHGDLKPSNVLMKNGRAFLNDFGSSTCISIGGSGSQRGPHGDINYRAPECFKEDAKPSTRADVWSLGAILYESITKEGIYEGINPSKLTGEKLAKQLKKKLRKIPRSVRPFLRKCLASSPWDRFYDGTEAHRELESRLARMRENRGILYTIKKWTVPAAAVSLIGGAIFYNALVTPEPQRLGMPQARIQGMLYSPGSLSEEQKIEFEQEEIENLPAISEGGFLLSGLSKNAKLSTDNRVVAYLTKAHAQAQVSRGWDRYTEHQFRTYMAYTTNDERRMGGRLSGTPWPIWTKSIEVALNQAKTAEGKVDLEDTMAISRVGVDTVNQAKRSSGSFDYRVYRTAKDSKGEYIIPKREQNFINTWIAYYKADVD